MPYTHSTVCADGTYTQAHGQDAENKRCLDDQRCRVTMRSKQVYRLYGDSNDVLERRFGGLPGVSRWILDQSSCYH